MRSQSAPRAGTKLATVNRMMRRRRGATKAELCHATGWHAYSFVTNGRDLSRRFGGQFQTHGRRRAAIFDIVKSFDSIVRRRRAPRSCARGRA
jgi:hypothetical protein